MLLICASSSPRIKDFGKRSRSLSIRDKPGSDTNRRSMLTPRRVILKMGTAAVGTGVNSVISDAGVISWKGAGNWSKKSIRLTCFGATTSVSISEPGLWTPNAKLPKKHTRPPAFSIIEAGRPLALPTRRMNSTTTLWRCARTSCLVGVSQGSR